MEMEIQKIYSFTEIIIEFEPDICLIKISFNKQ